MREEKIPNGTRVKMKDLSDMYRKGIPVPYGINADMRYMSNLLGTITTSDDSGKNYSISFDNGRRSGLWSISQEMFDVIVPFKSFSDLMEK